MIERLILSRFRGIRKGVIEKFGKLNFFVGPNNSGKTAVLEALYWLTVSGKVCMFHPDIPVVEGGIKAFIPDKKDLLGLQPCPRIWKRHGKLEIWHKPPGSVDEEGVFFCKIPHLNKKEYLKSFRLIPPPSEEIIDEEIFDKKLPEQNNIFVLDNPEGIDNILSYYLPDLYPDRFSLSDKKTDKYFAFNWYRSFIYDYKKLAVWCIEGNLPSSECVLFFDFHTTGNHFTSDFYRAIREVPDWREKLTDLFGKVFEVDNFIVNIEPAFPADGMMQGAIEAKGKSAVPIDDFGDGARHAFKVLASLLVLSARCKDGKEGIFLWEDPELFMHPACLWRLLNEVMNIIRDKPVQIFITTQNFELISYFAKVLTERTELQDNGLVFRLDLREGELITSRFNHDSLTTWLESDRDPRFWEYFKFTSESITEKGGQ